MFFFSFSIERFYGPLFAKIRARLLTVIDSPLVAIEDFVFYGLNRSLEQLTLLNTNLAQISPYSFGVSKTP